MIDHINFHFINMSKPMVFMYKLVQLQAVETRTRQRDVGKARTLVNRSSFTTSIDTLCNFCLARMDQSKMTRPCVVKQFCYGVLLFQLLQCRLMLKKMKKLWPRQGIA